MKNVAETVENILLVKETGEERVEPYATPTSLSTTH